MRASLRVLLIVPALAIAWSVGFAGSVRADRAQATLAITFLGSSTLHGFEGHAAPVTAVAETQPDGTWSADVDVPVATLDTGIAARDEKLRAMFDAVKHPQIQARLRGVGVEQVRSNGALPIVLQIREIEKPVQAKLSNWQQDDERHARFDADFEVSLAAFGLEPPKVLFMAVEDRVHVTVHVTLERL
jgi:polyisoprenoid-binding protein YceI